MYEKIVNARQDHLHKVSSSLISRYDIICIEDLHVKGMLRNRKLARQISDASWSSLVSMLAYKAKWNDRQLIKIPRWYPSSKTCHKCGRVKEDLELSIRHWTCANGHDLDRDINAAINILRKGIKINSAGAVENTGGETVRSDLVGHVSEKPEAHQSSADG